MSEQDPQGLDLVAVGTPIDLDNCAREPIHIPGSIQPRGVLIVVTEPDLQITQVSANLPELLGDTAREVRHGPLRGLIGAGPAEVVARATEGYGDLRERNPLDLQIDVDGVPVRFDAVLHRAAGNLLLLELEPATGPRPFSFPNTYLAVRGAVAELNRAASAADLYRITARAVRALTGFDRVMVYRYDADYNGEVVAEDRREDLESFLGLHYPASDIPAQARALYEKNWIRLISDVDYRPAPLVPVDNPVTGAPLDLTYSTLRSVSPIHIEYLKNMGVGASMSISLLRDGRLWGLIACHHYSGPHLPPYGTRTAAEFLGSALSLRLVDRVEEEELRARLASQNILAKITAAIQNPGERLGAGMLGAPDLFDLVNADGVMLDVDGERVSRGVAPTGELADALAGWVLGQDEGVFATDCLSRSAPSLALDPAEVSGVLALVLRDGRYVMWLRREAERPQDWGGDPHNKAVAVRDGDQVRLSPRRSFERWREVVRLHSMPWTADEQALASTLRLSLVEALYARSEREVRLAATLQRSLLPSLPALPGWRLSAHYEPAAGGRIGGDWYDAFRLPDGRLALVLGDVAGHGITAAGTMVQLRNALRAYLVSGVPVVAAVEQLNTYTMLLVRDAFATMALATIEPATGALTVVNAGHPVALLAGVGAEPVQAPLQTSPPVGVPGARYTAVELVLDPGAALVFFSDGLVERRGEDLGASFERLRSALGRMSGEPDADDVFAAVASPSRADDATVVVLRRGRS